MASTLDLLRRLTDRRVDFVIVGGVACVMHGCSLVTEDVDVCAPFTETDMQALLDALHGLHPRWRMTPARPPLGQTAQQLATHQNLYLVTDLGILDVLGEISGVGDFAQVNRHAIETHFGDVRCRVLDLPALIRAKRALGRPTDIRAAIELEAIRDRIGDERRAGR